MAPPKKAPAKKASPEILDEQPPIPILLHANAPWVGTGYGTQAALFGPRIARLGYRLAFSAFYGLHGSVQGWPDPTGQVFKVYPGNRDGHGGDVIGAHYRDWAKGQPGMVLTLTDPWVLPSVIMAQLPTVAWIPVDHKPLMPRTDAWCWKSGAVPIAMSHFGVERFEEQGHKPFYVPHGFDSDVFMVGDRQAARKLLGIPQDAFVVGMVAANKGNPSRKSYPEAIAAFSEFQHTVADEAILYLHTQLQYPGGIDLINLCEDQRVYPMSTDQYKNATGQSPIQVAALLNAFDVLLNPSAGEGFGVPLVEAQACGTPCITTNFSSMPEVAPEAAGNWTVDGQKCWTGFESWQVTPSIEQITDALTEAYEDTEKRRLERRAGVAAWAASEYDADYITETYWRPVLRDAYARINLQDKKMRTVVADA